MKNNARIPNVISADEQPAAGRLAAAVPGIRSAGSSAGEMALQNLFGHPATQSIPQGLVRLVGYRDPRPATNRPRPTQTR
ncbi:hypothetical protein RPB_2503 [Rhodopseudomonas palustris HaA2]|uniref:Uncharacterized protein n=1 Tax=Rhodopseudomonas palustris (strain HaA2) TaxID=316058 RepID=Q2IX52_RHOP2|nr:hypothetical protein [Rhodopseudomonas palustris]ABD07208.1 hypothetical protein RPB_2503 [Rhodopseudomonas palustris HaA2]